METAHTPAAVRFRDLVIGSILGLILGWLGHASLRMTGEQIHAVPGQQAPAVATYRDTVVRLVERPPIVVTGMRPRVRSGGEPVAYVENEEGDTILIAQPFVMEADTVQGNDTIQVRASFPPPSLSIAIRQGLDTLHELNKTMVVQLPPQYITREPSWIEKVGYGLIGAAVGAGGVLVATW